MKRFFALLISLTLVICLIGIVPVFAEDAQTSAVGELSAPEVIEGIPASSENFHIYLCIGQSNMVGADKIKKEDMVKIDGAYLYNLDSKWEIAQPYPQGGTEYLGFNRYSSVKPGSGKMGPTVGFARGMVKNVPAGVKVGIISNAIGGTTVQEWSKGYGQAEDLPLMDGRPDRNLYEVSVERTKEALKRGGVLKGIFYLQGESCAQKAGYMERLVKIADNLREDLGVKSTDVPFFVSEIPYVRPDGVKVIKTAPEHIENCYVISAAGLSIFDSIHFDAVSQRRLGLRFAQAALSKIYGIDVSADEMYKEIYKEEAPDIYELEQKVSLNGKEMTFDVAPKVAGGTLYIPVRAILEGLGGTVEWDEKTETVTCKMGGRTVIMQIGDEHITINGEKTAMGLAPMLRESRTLVPIEFIEKGLDALTSWIETTQTATIGYTEDEITKEFKPLYPDIANALTIYGLKQSGDDGTNSIVNILDGDVKTKWAVQADKEGNDGYGIIDLGEVKTLDKIYIAFQAHATRIYKFSIFVSENGTDYKVVVDKKETANKEALMEIHDVAGAKARYVKFVGHGNNQNGWNNLAEIVIKGK